MPRKSYVQKSLRIRRGRQGRRSRQRRGSIEGGFFSCNNYEAVLKQSVLDKLMDSGMFNDPTFLEATKRWTQELIKEINLKCKNSYCKRQQVLEKIKEFENVVKHWKEYGVINFDFSQSKDSHVQTGGIKNKDTKGVSNPF